MSWQGVGAQGMKEGSAWLWRLSPGGQERSEGQAEKIGPHSAGSREPVQGMELGRSWPEFHFGKISLVDPHLGCP